jgi:hypothetical protein
VFARAANWFDHLEGLRITTITPTDVTQINNMTHNMLQCDTM